MKNLIIGIDGGGSKTDFLLCDTEYNVIARIFAGRSNPNDIGIENTCRIISEGIAELCEKANVSANDISAAFAGVAGASSKNYAERIKSALSAVLPNSRCDALHDGVNVLYGAFPENDGVSIICGTGSSCFVKKGKDMFRIGGYGSFDLAGNGYEIGRKGIAHALKTVDGREERGLLEELLAKSIGDDFLKALDSLVLMSKTELAGFAPKVMEAAEKGDKAALKIIEESMDYIASLIARAGNYFEGKYKVALAGGILKNEFVFNMLSKKTDKRAELIRSGKEPAFGAAAKAKQLLT